MRLNLPYSSSRLNIVQHAWGAEAIRRCLQHLHADRPLYNDRNAMKELVKRCEILEEVEKAVGELG